MSDEESLSDVGLYGLAVMGQNFALNMASHEFKVCVGNRSPSKVDVTVQRAKDEGELPLVGAYSIEEFVSKLSKPRKVIILVMAGKPVDETIALLSEHMEEGDVIIDGGNEWYPNSVRRAKELEEKGIMFMGMGISGGEEGARHGPSLMPGGPREAYDLMEPILVKCAAQVDDSPCTAYLGPIGSGNYVKMVHNGIEYADMQLIAEVYDVLKNIVGMSNADAAAKFASWNEGVLGIRRDATKSEIRRSYRRLALLHHKRSQRNQSTSINSPCAARCFTRVHNPNKRSVFRKVGASVPV